MMPLLSLIFSALFILFGTVVIQAFRWVINHKCVSLLYFEKQKCSYTNITFFPGIYVRQSIKKALDKRKGSANFFCVFSVTQVKINRQNQRQRME